MEERIMKTVKKTVAVLTALLMLASAMLVFSSCNKEGADVPAGMKEASGDSVDYDLYIPSTWTSDVENGATTAYYSETDRSNISVMTFSANYTDDTLANWWSSFEADFKTVYSDFEIVSSESTVLDGVAALKTVFKGTLEDYEYQFMQVAAVKGAALSKPQIYVFTYTSVPEAYDSHLEDVQSVLDAFNFHGSDNGQSVEEGGEQTQG